MGRVLSVQRLSRQHTVALVLSLLAATAAFSGALTAPFQFDDTRAIVENSTISTAWSTAPAHPPRASSVAGRPVVNYTLALNRSLNRALGVDDGRGPDAPHQTVGFHLFNILIHLACGLVLFGLLRRTGSSARVPRFWSAHTNEIACAVAALWLLHPIQTEAVDYVIQRTELLVSLFYLNTLYASARAWSAETHRAKRAWQITAVVSCALGMGSKEVMIGAPVVVMLFDYAFVESSWKRLLVARGAFYACLGVAMILVFGAAGFGARSTEVGLALGVPWYSYLYTQMWAIAHYLRLIIWPFGFRSDYGQTPISGAAGIPGALFLLMLGVGTLVAWRRAPWLAFVGSWFFIAMAPSSSVVPIVTEMAAERRVYLALAPALLAIVLALETARRKFVARRANVRVVSVGVVGVCAALALLTWNRSRLYTDPEALWRQTRLAEPNNPRAYDHLAAAVLRTDRRRVGEASALLDTALSIDSTYMPAWTNRAELAIEAGDSAKAKDLLERALRIMPDYVDAHEKLAILEVKLGDASAALPDLERVVAAHPTADAYIAMANAQVARGDAVAALDALEHALAMDPTRRGLKGAIGELLVETGNSAEGVGYLEQAAELGQASSEEMASLSLAYAQAGRIVDTRRAARQSETRAGRSALEFRFLGRAYLLIQDLEAARQSFETALALAPDDAETITRLGIVAAAEGDAPKAASLFRRALSVRPGYAPAEESLRKLAATPP